MKKAERTRRKCNGRTCSSTLYTVYFSVFAFQAVLSVSVIIFLLDVYRFDLKATGLGKFCF